MSMLLMTAHLDASNEGAAAESPMFHRFDGIAHSSTRTSFQSSLHSYASSLACRVLQCRWIPFLFFWILSAILRMGYINLGNPDLKSLDFCLQTLYLLKNEKRMMIGLNVILKVSGRRIVHVGRDVSQSWRNEYGSFSKRLFSHSNYL